MKAKEFIPATKPRNFVAKNQKTAGAGAHKDKKKAEKQGDVKHKNKMYDEGVAEADSPAMAQAARRLTDPKDGAVAKLRAAGDKRRDDQLKGRDIANRDRTSKDEWGNLKEYGDTSKGQKMLTKVQKRAVDRVVSKKADTDPAYAKKNSDTANRAWDRMSDKD